MLGESSYAARAYTTPSSVLTRCSSVRSLLPSHTADFHLSASFGAGFLDPLPPLEGEHAQIRRSPATFHDTGIRATRGSVGRGLYIVSRETRDEPSCMSNNPFHQCTFSGRSVVCAFLNRCQHCAHSSLQLFLTVFNCSVALMRSSWRASDDFSLLTFGFHIFCPFDEWWFWWSHCKMMSQSPR